MQLGLKASHLQFRFILLMLFSIALNKGFCKAKVIVEFITPGPAQLVEVDMPIGNDCSIENPIYYTVKNGKFNFEVNVTKLTILQIKTSFKRIFLVVGPNDVIRVKILKTFDKYKVLSFEGPNAEGLYWYNVYNDQPLSNRINPPVLFAALSAKNKNVALEKLGKFIGGQTQPLTVLYKHRKISKQFYTLVKAELRAMHAQFIVERIKDLQDKISSKNDILNYQVIINAVMAFAGPNMIENARGMFGKNFLSEYYAIASKIKGKETSPEWGPYYSYTFAPDSIRMHMLGNALAFAKVTGTSEYDFKTAYGLFKKEFPHNDFVNFLDTVNSNTEPDRPMVNLRIDSASYSTFDDLRRHYKGQALYIDLWATWCMPCRAEFPYYKKLKPVLKKKKITSVFITIDQPSAKKVWQMLINFNGLEGDHIFVNKNLMKDIRATIYKNDEVSIPRYILINNKGKIISMDAPRPSSSELYRMLNKM
jgi:thiol-disulfide isomerase/thioredoxin